MTATIRIGDFTVSRAEEMIAPLASPMQMFPAFDKAEFDHHMPWLTRGHYDPATDLLNLGIHSWVLRTRHHTIVVDTCCGNDRDRPKFPIANKLASGYLGNLAAAGVRPEEVDFVLCTHLHVDHVGWNTKLENGRWVPTFPKAKYLFGKADYEFYGADNAKDPARPAQHGSFNDGVLPIVEAGQAVMIDGAHAIEDDALHLESAAGHTPGSLVLSAKSKGEAGLFVGDALHHPIQVFNPHWSSRFCVDPVASAATRQRLMEQCADTNCKLLPAHFCAPHYGKVSRKGERFSLAFGEDVAF